ncbi:hypothetical protein AB1Y20_011333 [Prymnesium parvum]|uniref:tRNA-binding domain-containing protein n=1 Tax=Prymnesium parvum TaxID=97485 RepID=A0AB34IMX3_PRYPA
MAYDPQNIFAKIIRGEIPSHKIFETEHSLAILDAFPVTPGHSLLLPKHACASITDMPAHVAANVLSDLPKLSRLVQAATGAPAVNIVSNSGKEAGQVVFHAHFHVIPRFAGDELVALKPSRSSMLSADEASAMLAKLRDSEGAYARTLAAVEELEAQMRAGSITAPPPPASPSEAAAKGKGEAAAKGKGEAAAKGKGEAAAKGKGEAAAKGKVEAAAKGKGEAAAKGKGEADSAGETASPAKGEEGKPFNTEKKVKAKKAGPAEAEAERPIDISWADIRVGLIVDATPHPESDKLYVETIDLGEEKPRQILSGLAQHMRLDEVKGARVVCICNLKPRKMANILSEGMVLCANDATSLAFVRPPDGAKPGDRVTWDGYPGEPVEMKKMDKKKGWEAIMPDLLTDKDGNATYKGTALWAVAGGICTTSVPNGTIK